MPEGISVAVENGFATIEFLDKSLRGATIQKLIDAGGAQHIAVDTGGTRFSYVVPEGIARDAGLVDVAATRRAPAKKAARK